MDAKRLYEILNDTTQEYRKGAEVTTKDTGAVTVTEIWNMPHRDNAPDNTQMIDVYFMFVGVNVTKGMTYKSEVQTILSEYPRLKQGLSYIEVGGELGDQGMALRLFGLGEAIGLWKVVTPAALGMDGPLADQMAGMGMVMTDGLRT